MPDTRDGGSPRQDPALNAAEIPMSPTKTFALPKHKGSGDLLFLDTRSSTISDSSQKRSSFHSGSSADQSSLPLSPGANEHEHGISASGLNRIRQQKPPRLPSSSLEQHLSLSRPPSTTQHSLSPFPSPSDANTLVEQNSTNVALGEDLTRFTSESLHSFSFANKSEEMMNSRQSILKRTLDFVRDTVGWPAVSNELGMATAHAKARGDPELQSMVELLGRTHLLDSRSRESDAAPLTGPAQVSSENPFDKSFAATNESPTSMRSSKSSIEPRQGEANTGELSTPTQGVYSVANGDSQHDLPPTSIDTSDQPSPRIGSFSNVTNRRSSLKRTFTDIAPLSLQSKLADALAQPFLAPGNTISSPVTSASATTKATDAPSGKSSSNAHGRAIPSSQAIFMTEAHEPWTMTSANDLACLIFGLSRAELRKSSILDVFREDKRLWLQSKLKFPEQMEARSPPAPPSPRKSLSPMTSPAMGDGLTARLLRKPPSREVSQSRRSVSFHGPSTSPRDSRRASFDPSNPTSSNVLLCGDVMPISKRNGDHGSVTLWVQQKRGSLIWVLEEIAEDDALLNVDEVGCVLSASGQLDAVWGMERVRKGMDIIRLLPGIPRKKGTNTGALDFDEIASLQGFTARTANDISVPVTVEQVSGTSSFRVSSFPHIAGMMVLSASDLRVKSSNAVVSRTLFGRATNGLPTTDIIPDFDKMLRFLQQEDNIQLIDGMVIPEQNFRRARAMLAMREGKEEAAAIFLRPSGLPATHRDGAEIMVDVQMRVLKSESLGSCMNDIAEEGTNHNTLSRVQSGCSEIVYALWISYSRMLHAANHGVGPLTPLVSRPGTPPQQPAPGNMVEIVPEDSSSDSDENLKIKPTKLALESRPKPRVLEAAATSSSEATGPKLQRSISDYNILEDMGAGAYGQVKLARLKPSSALQSPQSCKKVVIKYVTKRRILVDTWTRDRKLGTVPLEIHVLDYLRRDGLRHPNIVEMSGFFEDEVNYYIEMVPHGLPGMDLFDYIELRTNMAEEECRRIFKQVADAIHFLHCKAKVVHRDIKDENVILDGEGNIKLIDFGSANYIKNGPFDVFVGTIDYAAPEVLSGSSYSGCEQDMWALGILLYTILYKENPFYNIDEILDRDLRVPYVVSEESIELVRRMLDRDVEARADIREVVAHPWCTATEDPGSGKSAGAFIEKHPQDLTA